MPLVTPRPDARLSLTRAKDSALATLASSLRQSKRQSETERLFANAFHDDPRGWAEECIDWRDGEGLTDYQAEILDDLVVYLREAVRGPRGLGKTTDASLALLWFATTRDATGEDWKAGTTASTWEQLSHYLWPEVHKWARRIRWDRLGRAPWKEKQELLSYGLNLRHGQAFASSPAIPDAIEGMHADECLIIFDEAKIIPASLFDSIEGVFSNAGPRSHVYALAISIPGELNGRFYEIHAKSRGLTNWHTRHVTSDEVIAAGRMTETWKEERKEHWGEESPLYQNHVLGEFAASDVAGIIPIAWVEAAFDRYRAWLADDEEVEPLSAVGVDVGDSGADPTVFAERHGDVVLPLRRYPNITTMETAGLVMQAIEHGGAAIIDGIGIGSGVVARCAEQGGNVISFIASGKSVRMDRSGTLRFANKRAEAWWNLRDMLDPSTHPDLCLPPDDKLLGDLVAPHWRPLSNGRMIVESKDDLRKRIGRSTDDGDAVVMSVYEGGGDAAEVWGMITCDKCGELYNSDPTGKERACPYCTNQVKRWRPAPALTKGST